MLRRDQTLAEGLGLSCGALMHCKMRVDKLMGDETVWPHVGSVPPVLPACPAGQRRTSSKLSTAMPRLKKLVQGHKVDLRPRLHNLVVGLAVVEAQLAVAPRRQHVTHLGRVLRRHLHRSMQQDPGASACRACRGGLALPHARPSPASRNSPLNHTTKKHTWKHAGRCCVVLPDCLMATFALLMCMYARGHGHPVPIRLHKEAPASTLHAPCMHVAALCTRALPCVLPRAHHGHAELVAVVERIVEGRGQHQAEDRPHLQVVRLHRHTHRHGGSHGSARTERCGRPGGGNIGSHPSPSMHPRGSNAWPPAVFCCALGPGCIRRWALGASGTKPTLPCMAIQRCAATTYAGMVCMCVAYHACCQTPVAACNAAAGREGACRKPDGAHLSQVACRRGYGEIWPGQGTRRHGTGRHKASAGRETLDEKIRAAFQGDAGQTAGLHQLLLTWPCAIHEVSSWLTREVTIVPP